jgi:hypothetical protein
MPGKINGRNLALSGALAAVLALGFLGGRAVADQPHMRAALEHLRAAKSELEISERDKGGHRAKALRFVNDAIGQCEMGMQFDRTH